MHPTSTVHPVRGLTAAVLAGLMCMSSVSPYAFAQTKTSTTSTVSKSSGTKYTAKMTDTQKKDSAKKHYTEGKKKLDANNYEGALVEFRAANDVLPAPATQQKIAFCLDQLGRTQDAVTAY